MKALVVYYSRTGTTKKAAELVAEKLSADIEEIHDNKKRAGPIGYAMSGIDGAKEKLTTVMEAKHDPEKYDIVVVGTPIWVGKMSSGARTYLTGHKDAIKKAAFLIVSGSGNIEKCESGMKEVLGADPVATLSLRTKEVKNEDIGDRVQEFVDSLKAE